MYGVEATSLSFLSRDFRKIDLSRPQFVHASTIAIRLFPYRPVSGLNFATIDARMGVDRVKELLGPDLEVRKVDGLRVKLRDSRGLFQVEDDSDPSASDRVDG